jgi:hypothetical protein
MTRLLYESVMPALVFRRVSPSRRAKKISLVQYVGGNAKRSTNPARNRGSARLMLCTSDEAI